MTQSRFLLTLTALAGVVTLAGWGRCGHPRSHDPAEMAAFITDRVDDTLDDLDATPEQRTQIHAIKDRLLARAAELHKDHGAARQEVLTQWQSPNPDRAKLHALVDERAERMRAFAHEAVDAGVEVHGVLTPEQRAQLTRKMERMQRWHR